MANAQYIAETIHLSLSIALVLCGLKFFLFRTFTEEFRQGVFFWRRELFLLTAARKVEPSDPGYTYLRTTMNGLLRLAEAISFTRLLFVWSLCPVSKSEYRSEWEARISGMHDAHLRRKLSVIDQKVGGEVVSHVIKTSFLLLVAFCFAVLALLAGSVFRRFKKPVAARPLPTSHRTAKVGVARSLESPLVGLRREAETAGHTVSLPAAA